MKLAAEKWNLKITINGKTGVPYYYGFKTKKQATEIAEKWNKLENTSAEVFKQR